MESPGQQSLFDVEAPGGPGNGLVRIGRRAGRLSPEQRSFNRLCEQIEHARAALQQWESEAPRLMERVTRELMPQMHALEQAQRALVEYLDAFLTTPPKGARLGKRQRGALTDLLCDVVEGLLAGRHDTDLEAIYDRHNAVSYREEQEEARALEMELAEGMLGRFFGEDILDGNQAQSAEELLQHVHARLSEAAQAEAVEREARAAKRSKRRGPSKREQEAQAASQSVREVYRKLASSLHPDREADPDERARKTMLMQRLNQAYRRNDLLSLLGMQIEMEHIDHAALAGLPVERLRHYNRVLKEQLAVLRQETIDRAGALLDALGMDPLVRVDHPRDVDRLLDARLRELRVALSDCQRVPRALADPQQRKAELASIVEAMKEANFDDIDFLDDLIFAGR
ncbi:MAG: hypothetical protein ACK4RW_07525 [Rehaibacterium terrae]|uniref:J domain-containing protein n=1 Tax=Rehaibacterium terrae TaxID=1341696 RepID=UPI00391DB3B8